LRIHPAPYESRLILSGESSKFSLMLVTTPLTGEYNSETVLTASISPNGSPATTLSPISGNSKKIISPS